MDGVGAVLWKSKEVVFLEKYTLFVVFALFPRRMGWDGMELPTYQCMHLCMSGWVYDGIKQAPFEY